MRPILALVILLFAASLGAIPGPTAPAQPVAGRFVAYDLIIDPGDQDLAAYQVEIAVAPGAAPFALVGVEGAADGPYASPPFYDPEALHADAFDRVILAAFVAEGSPPRDASRVARLHLRVEGDAEPEFVIRLIAAGADERTRIEPAVRLSKSTSLEGAR